MNGEAITVTTHSHLTVDAIAPAADCDLGRAGRFGRTYLPYSTWVVRALTKTHAHKAASPMASAPMRSANRRPAPDRSDPINEPRIATPKTPPICRPALSAPAARPDRSRPSESRAARFIAGVVSPVPTPAAIKRPASKGWLDIPTEAIARPAHAASPFPAASGSIDPYRRTTRIPNATPTAIAVVSGIKESPAARGGS
jgi:hypothetical protein